MYPAAALNAQPILVRRVRSNVPSGPVLGGGAHMGVVNRVPESGGGVSRECPGGEFKEMSIGCRSLGSSIGGPKLAQLENPLEKAFGLRFG